MMFSFPREVQRVKRLIVTRAVLNAVISAALSSPISFPSGEKTLITPTTPPVLGMVTILIPVLVVFDAGMKREVVLSLVTMWLRRGWWISFSPGLDEDPGADCAEKVPRDSERAFKKRWHCSGVRCRRRWERSCSGRRSIVTFCQRDAGCAVLFFAGVLL